MSNHKRTGPSNGPHKDKSNPKHYFDSVVGNAIEFFETSIKDFKDRPKYSIINFCSGLELVLKARLLTEHWTLILKSPEKADLATFPNGNFQSVNIVESIDRLTKICNESFTSDEKKCFERLRDHRNKVVHFCHDAYSKKPDKKILEEVAAEQCMAWWYLHRRLMGGWAGYFEKHNRAIERINKALHGHRVFLQTKYRALKPEIDKEVANGREYRSCFACGCLAASVDEIQEPVFQAECRVCGTCDSFLRLACPKCKNLSDIDDLASGVCENEECEADITLYDVMKKYVPSYDPRDGDEEQAYYCASCEHPNHSATILGDKHFCFSCKEWFDFPEQCNFCGAHLVGFDPDGSGYYGCFMCETAAKEHYDKD